MEIPIQVSKDEYKDIVSYCELNKFNIDDIVKKSFLEGFRIEKYGLLNSKSQIIEKEVVKEIIKEVPVEKIVEVPIDRVFEKIVEVVKEVPVEIIKEVPLPPVEVIKYVDREVIKEVFIEKDVSNNDNFYDKNYVDDLLRKIQDLENRPTEIKEVIKEIPVEVVKEVIVEKSDETTKTKINALQTTLQTLRQENIDKDKKLKECEKIVDELKKFNNDVGAVYLNRSNLDDKLYK